MTDKPIPKILIPLPCCGFDPAEVAIPWLLLSRAGFDVVFTTPNGDQSSPDIWMLKGIELGIFKPVLQTRRDAVEACIEMQSCLSFMTPLKYDDVNEHDFDALLLPGGHDKGVKEYLESTTLQALVVDFLRLTSPLALFVMAWY